MLMSQSKPQIQMNVSNTNNNNLYNNNNNNANVHIWPSTARVFIIICFFEYSNIDHISKEQVKICITQNTENFYLYTNF